MNALAAATPQLAVTTAGLCGMGWQPEWILVGDRLSVHGLRTADQASLAGYLVQRGRQPMTVCLIHLRAEVITSYIVPGIHQGGCASWTQATRLPGRNLQLEYKLALLDLAAAQLHLFEEAVFEFSVLLGNPDNESFSVACPSLNDLRCAALEPVIYNCIPPSDAEAVFDPHAAIEPSRIRSLAEQNLA